MSKDHRILLVWILLNLISVSVSAFLSLIVTIITNDYQLTGEVYSVGYIFSVIMMLPLGIFFLYISLYGLMSFLCLVLLMIFKKPYIYFASITIALLIGWDWPNQVNIMMSV